jgi:hypothetical protein
MENFTGGLLINQRVDVLRSTSKRPRLLNVEYVRLQTLTDLIVFHKAGDMLNEDGQLKCLLGVVPRNIGRKDVRALRF